MGYQLSATYAATRGSTAARTAARHMHGRSPSSLAPDGESMDPSAWPLAEFERDHGAPREVSGRRSRPKVGNSGEAAARSKINVGESTFAFNARAYSCPTSTSNIGSIRSRPGAPTSPGRCTRRWSRSRRDLARGRRGAQSRIDIERNMENKNAAVLQGWRVLRSRRRQVKSGVAIAMTQQLLHATSGEGSDARPNCVNGTAR